MLLFIFCFDVACYLFRIAAKCVQLVLEEGKGPAGGRRRRSGAAESPCQPHPRTLPTNPALRNSVQSKALLVSHVISPAISILTGRGIGLSLLKRDAMALCCCPEGR